jgi:hypothetical protein
VALSDSTLLGLEKIGGGFSLPEYAARGITMTMQPISEAAQLVRDVNGNMIDAMDGFEQFRKYECEISCDDMDSPAFAADSTADDPVWPGDKFTVTCLPHLGAEEPIVLTMMCMTWNVSRDEWGAATSWSMKLAQV